MTLRHLRPSAWVLGFALLAGCAPAATADLSAAQTIAALSTQVALSAPTATVTPPEASALPTDTATQPPTATFTPSETIFFPDGKTFTPTRTLAMFCNAAFFVGDVGDIRSGTELQPFVPFTKIWDVRNYGTCTWDADYQIILNAGERMESKNKRLGRIVAPNDHIFIAVDMVAPEQAGGYHAEWKLMSSDGKKFGVGSDGKQPLRVYIRVVP
jgi:hypothetical protein